MTALGWKHWYSWVSGYFRGKVGWFFRFSGGGGATGGEGSALGQAKSDSNTIFMSL